MTAQDSVDLEDNFTGEHVIQNENGRVVVAYERGKKNGLTRFVDADGVVLTEINYENDAINGEMKSFHPSGMLQTCANFRDGVQHGSFVSFYENGMKQVESNYVDGRLSGAFLAFDEFGDRSFECEYRSGLRHGLSLAYYPRALGGSVFERSFYENGLLQGDVVTYRETGEIISVTPYAAGCALEYTTRFKG